MRRPAGASRELPAVRHAVRRCRARRAARRAGDRRVGSVGQGARGLVDTSGSRHRVQARPRAASPARRDVMNALLRSAGRVAATQCRASSAEHDRILGGRGARLERLGDALVGPLTACRAELLIERVLDQRVREPVTTTLAALDEHRRARPRCPGGRAAHPRSRRRGRRACRPRTRGRSRQPSESTLSASSPSLSTRRPTTSRTLLGRPSSSSSPATVQRPSSPSTIAPVSPR